MDNTFVRSDMLPPQPPPMREQGAVKWLRDNLFSGWLNSILTILGILATTDRASTSARTTARMLNPEALAA